MKRKIGEINWGRGRLNKYESVDCFTAKFCGLNGIGPKEARKFLTNYLKISEWPPSNPSPFLIDVFAKLLDEPLPVVKTVFSDDLDLPACFGTFRLDISKKYAEENFSYCDECIRFGYHANFHQMPWFSQCLLHGIPLKQQTISKKHWTIFDQRVLELLKLFEEADSLLVPPPKNSDQIFLRPESLRQFQKIKQWFKSIQLAAYDLAEQCIWTNQDVDYQYRHLDILLSRLSWLQPISRSIESYFEINRKKISPLLFQFDENTLEALKKITGKVSLDELIWFYRKTVALTEAFPSYKRHVTDAIFNIETRHPQKACKCIWGFNKRSRAWSGMWLKVEPNGWPYWDLDCPYSVAIAELKGRWIDFFGEHRCWTSSRRKSQDWRDYIHYASILQRHGLVSEIRLRDSIEFTDTVASRFGKPCVILNLDSEVIKVIEHLLEAQVYAEIQEINYWLTSVESGKLPWTNRYLPASANLFAKDKLTLMSWAPFIS